jgi:hypothetical protein
VVNALFDSAFLADFEHVCVDIGDSDVDIEAGRVGVVSPALFKDFEADVACAASHVEAAHGHKLVSEAALAVQDSASANGPDLVDEIVLPYAVHAHGHSVVHDVVLFSDVAEHAAHQLLLLGVVYIFKAEVYLLAEKTACPFDHLLYPLKFS